MSIYKFYQTNFKFVANRYEEWQGGRCISQGAISTEIISEVSGNEVHFELNDIGNLRILKSFDSEILGEDYCILSDRIQYSHATSDYNPIVTIVCNIFSKGATIDYVRFAMTNPDRLIEFYGELVYIGQPSVGKRIGNNTNEVSANDILQELRGYGMLNAEAAMERAVKIYNSNANVETLSQVKAVIECLRLFVKAYQLDEQDYEDRISEQEISHSNRSNCIWQLGNIQI